MSEGGGMEGCSKSSAGAVSRLPDDPLVEILSRVPAKSVCRFKCVSKAWRDLIAHPDHRKKLRQPMQGLFVQNVECTGDGLGSFSFRLHYSFSFIDLGTMPLDVDPCVSFLTEMTGIKIFSLMDSCNGLILFGHNQGPYNNSGGYIVGNPTTTQWLAVPPCGSLEAFSQTYMAFDPAVSSHFHLVQFQVPDDDELVESLHVYSSETGTWSQNQINEEKEQGHLEGWHHRFKLGCIERRCAFVSGFLHLIVWDSDKEHILVVDVQGKARRMINVPGMADGRQEHSWTCYLGQCQGQLHLVTRHKERHELSIWVLQNYDTQEWVLKNVVDYVDVFGETGSTVEIRDFQVVDIHQDCNVVFILQRFKLIAYDMDRKEVSVIATFDSYKCTSDFARYIPYFSKSPALIDKH